MSPRLRRHHVRWRRDPSVEFRSPNEPEAEHSRRQLQSKGEVIAVCFSAVFRGHVEILTHDFTYLIYIYILIRSFISTLKKKRREKKQNRRELEVNSCEKKVVEWSCLRINQISMHLVYAYEIPVKCIMSSLNQREIIKVFTGQRMSCYKSRRSGELQLRRWLSESRRGFREQL